MNFALRVVLRQPDFSLVEKSDLYPWFVYAMQENLKQQSNEEKLLLPNLHEAESVSVFSDYGGEHPGSRYNTYSFLICAHGPRPFTESMAELRNKYGMNKPFKEIKFKKLAHGPTSRLLPEYLRLLDNLVIGTVFTVVIDKRVTSAFGTGKKEVEDATKKALNEAGMSYLKLSVAEKLFRIVHCSSYLTALLTREGQKVFWMTDNDAIAETPARHNDTLALFNRLLCYYSKHKFKLVGGATPFAEKSAEFLDLLSVPDLVGGAVESYMTNRQKSGDKMMISEGVNLITEWLSHQGVSMKKHTMLIEPHEDGIKCGVLNFYEKFPNPDAVFLNIKF